MRTRGERRRLTTRAIKRKWSRYLATQGLLVDGMYPSTIGKWVRGEMRPSKYFKGEMIQALRCHMLGVEWCPIHRYQLQPHRMNKKNIDNSPDHWPGRRHNMDWDAPTVHDWDEAPKYEHIHHSVWRQECPCRECVRDREAWDMFYDVLDYWDDIAVDTDEEPPAADVLDWDALFPLEEE